MKVTSRIKAKTKEKRTGVKTAPIARSPKPKPKAPDPPKKSGLKALAKPAASILPSTGVLIPALQRAVFDHDSGRDTSYLHASELEGYCPRRNTIAHAFDLDLPTLDPSFNLYLTFAIGHAVHEHYQNHLLARGGVILGQWWCPMCGRVVGGAGADAAPRPTANDCESHPSGTHYWRYVEMSAVDEKNKIGGSIDGFVKPRTGLEIKTISQRGFDGLRGVKPEHVTQAQVYMHLFDLEEQHFLYVSKGYHEPSERLDRVAPGRGKPTSGWRCGPVAEFTLQRDQKTINELLSARQLELDAVSKVAGGVEHYPKCLEICRSRISSTVKNCPVGAICMDLKKEGR